MTRLYQNFIGGDLDATLGDNAGGTDTTMSSPALAAMRDVVAPDVMTVTLDPSGGDPEIVYVTAHTAGATTATILRAQENTTAREHLSGVAWRHDFTARAISDLIPDVDTETGTTYTVVADDRGRIKRFTDTTLVTVTLPVDLEPGFLVHLLFVGAAGGEIVDDGTSTVVGAGTVDQNGEASCLVESTDSWNVVGAA